MQAALHARLKEQYAGLLGIVATSTPGFSSSTVRHWVKIGRLPRPWQVAEAITHLEKTAPEGAQSEDERWLADLLKSTATVPGVKAVQPPRELNQFVSAYILVAHSVRRELQDILSQSDRQDPSCVNVLLYNLAFDCEVIVSRKKAGYHFFRTWGWAEGKSFQERFNHYNTQDMWVVLPARDKVLHALSGFQHMFEPMNTRSSSMLIPTPEAAEIARSRYPEVAEAAVTVLQAQEK